jgi:hypothetical protein
VYTASHVYILATTTSSLARNGDAAHSKQHGFTATPDLEADADADAARSILEIKLTDLHLGIPVVNHTNTANTASSRCGDKADPYLATTPLT